MALPERASETPKTNIWTPGERRGVTTSEQENVSDQGHVHEETRSKTSWRRATARERESATTSTSNGPLALALPRPPNATLARSPTLLTEVVLSVSDEVDGDAGVELGLGQALALKDVVATVEDPGVEAGLGALNRVERVGGEAGNKARLALSGRAEEGGRAEGRDGGGTHAG